MRTSRVVWVTVAGTLAALVLTGLVVLFTGAYNVAATQAHSGPVRWALNTLQQNSVGARAEPLDQPLPSDTESLRHGLEHFEAMCVVCHGAPGVERGEIGRGITPTPPALSEAASEWSDAELVWIIEHGIRLAGMPAFGPTHSDEEIRGLAAFVRTLSGMTPDQYRARASALRPSADSTAGGAPSPHGDDHAH